MTVGTETMIDKQQPIIFLEPEPNREYFTCFLCGEKITKISADKEQMWKDIEKLHSITGQHCCFLTIFFCEPCLDLWKTKLVQKLSPEAIIVTSIKTGLIELRGKDFCFCSKTIE